MKKIFDILFNEKKDVIIKGKKVRRETDFEDQEIFTMEINKINTNREVINVIRK